MDDFISKLGFKDSIHLEFDIIFISMTKHNGPYDVIQKGIEVG